VRSGYCWLKQRGLEMRLIIVEAIAESRQPARLSTIAMTQIIELPRYRLDRPVFKAV
jgi:hypothetical protein